MSVSEIKAMCDFDVTDEPFVEKDCVKKFNDCMEQLKRYLSSKSRTSKLWIQYLDYVDILRQFICAARSGDWNLNLKSLEQMLNLFAAAGHTNYAKSGRLYLQLMLNLSDTHPWLYQKLAAEGHHFIRRTDKFWAGLWPDLVIEQVLMRSLKNRGGLTRGRGMSPAVRMVWIRSMHMCSEIHKAMTTMTDHHHTTSEQHQELGSTRIKRDFEELLKVGDWCVDRNPFDETNA